MYAHTHPFWFYPFTCLVPGVPEAQRLFGQDRQLELRGSRSAEPSNSLVQDEILAENRREDIVPRCSHRALILSNCTSRCSRTVRNIAYKSAVKLADQPASS
jgi:hypothetical protein